MIKSTLNLVIFLLFSAVCAASAVAQHNTMYSYTDENGTVVFTDKPPVGRDAEKQAIPAGPPPQSNDNPYAQADAAAPSSTAQQRREEIARRGQLAQAEQAQRNQQCTEWQSEVERLEPNRRVFYENEKGETVRMDDVERVNRVADLKARIEAHCG